MISWQWATFKELSRDNLFEILKVRQSVFVVEQHCVYQDADNLDPKAFHLLGWNGDKSRSDLVAYARVVLPGEKFIEPSIGRLLTVKSVRGTGLGKKLTSEAISRTIREFPNASIRISAQKYLEDFYFQFGFNTVSEPYDEDGIPHIEMLRR